MNAFVWTTFALLVVVAPSLAVGTGAVVGRARRRPVTLMAVPSPEVHVEVHVEDVPEPEVAVVEPVTVRACISVEPRPDGRWAVRKAGATRASRVFDRKDDAVARAQAQAARERAELVIREALVA